MAQTSFTSRICPVSQADFRKITATIDRKNFVAYPWTYKESRCGNDVFTTNIEDCSACLLTNGTKSFLMHLTPDSDVNQTFGVEKFIMDKFELSSADIQAVLVGSRRNTKSQKIYNKLQEFLNKFQIPTSELKITKDKTNLAYKTSCDEIYISSPNIDAALDKNLKPMEILKNHFEKVVISDCDEV